MADQQQESTEVLVVGAGQAGIAMSEHLNAKGIPHLVLERARVAERWRSERWDSLVANGPAWHDRFPGRAFALDPDAFASKDEVAEYLAAYAEQIGAPIRTGTAVIRAQRKSGGGFVVDTSAGTINAKYLVAATGAFQHPVIPSAIPTEAGLEQIHSSDYKNPEQLPAGAVLVIGAGSSGVQIAAELRARGREVVLAVGAHDRPPRSYRGRDFVWWLGVLNKWDAAAPPAGAEHVTIAVSGADGGHTVDFRKLAQTGITLTGRFANYRDGTLYFEDGLARDIAAGDENYLGMLREADAYIERNGLDLPEEPEAYELGEDPDCLVHPIREISVNDSGITSVVWATGYGVDYSWLDVDAFDERGRPRHQRGVSVEPGIYFLGLPWQSRRGSSFIWGVWHDAKYIADQIEIQRNYLFYRGAGESVPGVAGIPEASAPVTQEA